MDTETDDTLEPVRLFPEDCNRSKPVPAAMAANGLQSADRFDAAVRLIASGCKPTVISKLCGFKSVAAVRMFMRSEECKEALNAYRAERRERIGDRALARLDSLLSGRQRIDSRSLVAAIRTGIDVAGQRSALPVKQVADLSVAELRQMIADTRRELEARNIDSANQLPTKEGAAQ